MTSRTTASLLLLVLFASCSSGTSEGGTSEGLREADRLAAAGDLPGAIQVLERLRGEEGPSTEVMVRLARAFERQSEVGRAVTTYKEGLEADPKSSELWIGLGEVYLGLEQFERARDAFLAARAGGAGDARISVQLATCQAQLHDLAAADVEFEKARAAGLPPTMIDFNIAVLRIGQGEREQGIALLESILAREPEHHPAQRELAGALLARGEPDAETLKRALDLAWKALQALPEDWRAHDVVGQVYLAQKDWEAAKAAFVEALRLGRNPPRVEDHYVQAEEMRRASQKSEKGDSSEKREKPSGQQPLH